MRPRLSCLALALLAPLFTGCHIGPQAPTFRPALKPDGARAEIETRAGTVAVELLAAADSGLIVLVRDTVIAFAPNAVVQSIRVLDFPDARLKFFYDSTGKRSDPAWLESVRLVSRFPQGINAALLAQMLASRRQREPEVLK